MEREDFLATLFLMPGDDDAGLNPCAMPEIARNTVRTRELIMVDAKFCFE
jgi:hypothetical protein